MGVFVIGQQGPAGGIIFYDKGSDNDGWRYLEAAPANSEFDAQWGAIGKDVSGTRTEIGYGKSNTQIIAKFLNNVGEKDKAAQRCLALNINGHNDWFLPCKDELNLMHQNLKVKGLGNFVEYEWYWSSSQYEGNQLAWGQHFKNGRQGSSLKGGLLIVRAVRFF